MSFSVISPKTKSELLQSMKQKIKFRFGAGCTDLLLELKKKPADDLTVINLSQLHDVQFTDIKKSVKGLRLGAGVTAHHIVMSEEIKTHYPVLYEAARSLASTQIRQVATVGGNLCTASPSGDIACALMALEAECEIMNVDGKKRTVTIKEFFIGVRKTAMEKDELLYGINIPAKNKNTKIIFSRFLKIGTRKSMECSVVSLAYHIQADAKGKIIHSGIAIGASAPTIRFTDTACDFLLGKNIYETFENDKQEFAGKVIAYASPISDIRATAWYRKEVLFNISKSIFENIAVHEK
jgi:CO/xanthine dehydrogenase FAD-binding subunit